MIYLKDLDINNMNPAVKAQIEAALQEQEKSEPIKDNAPIKDNDNSAPDFLYLLSLLPKIGRNGGATRGGDVSARTLAMETGNCNIMVEEYSPSLEEAVKLDQFFDMYGYATNSVKVPNEDSRESWNYVKTDNVIINGSMPVQDMAVIKAMYNRGVRFWHTTDVGNYSLSNRDMKEVVKDDVS